MKHKYVQAVSGHLEYVDGDLVVVGAIHKVDMDLVNRTRIFIDQILPDMVYHVRTVPEVEFALECTVKETDKFMARLERDGMFEESNKVAEAAYEIVKALSKLYKEAIKNEDPRSD